MRWLTNFYDLRLKWTATAAIGMHPTKALLSQLVIFKNAIWVWGHFRRTICNNSVLNLEKMPQKRMERFRLLFDHLAWIKHRFLSVIRDSKKAESLWGMMRGVGGVRKSIHQSWLGYGYYVEVLREFRKRFLGKRPALFKLCQWHFHQNNTPVNNSILVTDYLTKMGIKKIPHRAYIPDVGPCDFCLFPKLRGCRYETIAERLG